MYKTISKSAETPSGNKERVLTAADSRPRDGIGDDSGGGFPQFALISSTYSPAFS